MIKQLTIQNFKRFKHKTVLDLSPITVLLGANNSGKSTVLQALSIFSYCLEVTRKKKNGGYILDTRTIGPDEFGALPVPSPNDLWPDGKPTGAIHIGVEFDDGAKIAFDFKLAYNRFSITPTVSGNVALHLDGSKIRHVPIHSGLALREEYLMAPARAERMRELRHGSVIRNLLWDLKENSKDRWKKLIVILDQLYPAAKLDVKFDADVDRFITSIYNDTALAKPLDLVVAGTGFQQVLQIFSSVLTQGSGLVLLDEPDAHLHARLQVELMRVFESLAADDGIQFLMATHSPHLLAAAPAGSLYALVEGRPVSFGATAEQMDVLDSLGAFDRMEILPLLRTKAVVFVENRDDRAYLELFARKLWTEKKARKVLDGLCFLYTYQEPVGADVKRLARQVNDLLRSDSMGNLASGKVPRFLVIGDRDYRSAAAVKEAKKQLLVKSKTPGFNLDLKCEIWSRNEIENYLIDYEAIKTAALASLRDEAQKGLLETVLKKAWDAGMAELKQSTQERIAAKLQFENYEYKGDYGKTTLESQRIIATEWEDGVALCDAKKLLSRIRMEFQKHNIRAKLNEAAIIEAMESVPGDIKRILSLLQKHAFTGPADTRSTAGGKPKSAKPAK